MQLNQRVGSHVLGASLLVQIHRSRRIDTEYDDTLPLTDPKKFLIEYLVTLKQSGKKKHELFSEQDLGTMFGMYDVTGKGVIDGTQVANALNSLGCRYYKPLQTLYTKAAFVQLCSNVLADN